MKKNLLMIVAAGLVLASCNKKGCTDVNASNYSEEATKDNGECTYESTVTFWYNQQTSIQKEQAGVTDFKVYVGEVLAVTHPVETYEVIAPDCGDVAKITVTKNLNKLTEKSYTWQFKDQNDNPVFSGTWEAVGGGCDIIQVQ
ncbi:hypothetical protein K6119_02310 [Paracrocinitomix mangrovi]|uniref:hypothetical protein n=1 Tax=Paracrocinitomix mangrovi TaxID=2862509 RepID=UPI001C8EF5C1|nr:hypothetical protein [Paracrocinitomix mangrovi]UKN02353.1 hypothetical protein K6119_02310 [Paracrocinitomix mangrovi]